MKEKFHSVKLLEEKCKGCTKCMVKCPVEAVRVKNQKAVIYGDKCIDCGECIRVCPYNAHEADKDNIEIIKNYRIKICIPSVTIYSQFGGYINPDRINEAIQKLGFDEVFDISYVCDIALNLIKKEIESMPKPVISSFCPAVERLIENSYPNLLDHVVKLITPIEMAASIIRDKYIKQGYKFEEIGIFCLVPCAAWITKIKNSFVNQKFFINGAFAISDVYSKILKYLDKDNRDSDTNLSYTGLSWAISGGQSESMGIEENLAVDGTTNVIKILDDIELGKYSGIECVEAWACTLGCIGGVLLVDNPFNALRIMKNIAGKFNFNYRLDAINEDKKVEFITRHTNQRAFDAKLADDFKSAVKKMKLMNSIINALPGKDCGHCGSPSCRAFAEDVVRGLADINDCKLIKKEDLK